MTLRVHQVSRGEPNFRHQVYDYDGRLTRKADIMMDPEVQEGLHIQPEDHTLIWVYPLPADPSRIPYKISRPRVLNEEELSELLLRLVTQLAISPSRAIH